VYSAGAVLWLLGESLECEMIRRHHADGFLTWMTYPETAGAHVRLRVHGVEPLPLGKSNYRFEAPEQGFRGRRVQTRFICHG
jgi:hypothetical protein